MIIWRVLGGIGRTLITAGILILMFVGYQLWGTGVLEAQAQDALDTEFTKLLEEAQQITGETPVEQVGLDSTAAENAVDPGTDSADGTVTSDDASAAAPTPVPLTKASIPPEFLYRSEGEVVARILIDAINVDKSVVEGTGVEPLREGPGHYPTTVFPGQPGNAAIAGHRTTYGAPFHRIDELVPGDIIKIQTIQGVHTYEVDAHEDASGNQVGHFIVDPGATWVLGDFDDNRLTLTACHPKYSAAKRIVVTATLVSDPVELIPRNDGSSTGNAELQGDETSTVEDGAVEQAQAVELISDEVAVDDDPSVELNADGQVVPVGSDDGSGPTDLGVEDGTIIDEVPTGAEDQSQEDFGEGLNGDRSAILPSLTWGIAGGAIWLAAWFVGTKWHKIPMYAVGILPFGFALWMAFVHIDQALPSY